MLKTIEMTGRTEDAAIAAALEELGLERDDVSVEILTRAKSGFLGIGAVQAKVRISFETPDEPAVPAAPAVVEKPVVKAVTSEKNTPAQKSAPKTAPAPKPVVAEEKVIPTQKEATPAMSDINNDEPEDFKAIRSFLEGLLQRMNVKADIVITRRENDGINVNLAGNAMGAIIGRRGETLDAIQHLTNYVVNKGSEKHLHISVDAEAYRSKREESLTKLAEKMAEKAVKYKRSMALEPMNSYERHVIHTALQNYEGVTTSSTGVEPNRRVVVSYVKPETQKPKSREWA